MIYDRHLWTAVTLFSIAGVILITLAITEIVRCF